MTPSLDVQRLLLAIPGLLLLLRPDARFTIVGASDDYLHATHTDATIVGQALFDVFPENPLAEGESGAAGLRRSLERVLSSRCRDAMDVVRYDVRAPGGNRFEERYWLPVNSPVLDEDGAVVYIVHRVEEAAAKANRDARAILESITEGFFTLDRQWRFDYVNPEAHRILGREPGELAGRVLWEVYPGLEGTDFEVHYRRAMQAREKAAFAAYYAAHARWYEVTVFPAPEGISVYFRDVSEQRRLEAEREALAIESERQRRIYETALDSTPDFVYVFDLEHRALYANAALRKTWGVDDVRGKRWMDLGYLQWQADRHDRELRHVIETRAPYRAELEFTGTDGPRLYDYIFAPVLGANGEVVAVAGTTRDVTERKADEQAARLQALRLAESDRAKDEFLATLSHELRNPLTPLRFAVELWRRSGPADPDSERLRAMMERQIAHLIRLVDDLLEVSRISGGAFELRPERADMMGILRNAIETSAAWIERGDHVLDTQALDEPLWIEGDRVRLAQVFTNLLNNAAVYSEPGRTIALRVRREADAVLVSVRDQGVGIEPEAMARLFEMFHRVERNTARNQGGLGVGLALSRRIVEMHRGTLEARSEGPGCGSEFTVRLPLQPDIAAAPPSAARSLPTLDGLRVLVIDDNVDAAESLALLAQSLGAEARVAHDGPRGIAAFEAWHPNVVLLDIGMPEMNGYAVARAIRHRFPDSPARLVAHTGWGQKDDRAQVRAAGFDDHLVKPVELDALARMLSGAATALPRRG